jgi:hypothetical protein
MRQESLQIVNLLVWNWDCHASNADQSDDSFSMKKFHAQPRGQIEARERVAREQRNIDRLTAVAPAVEFFEQRKVGLQAFALKLRGYFSFKTVPGLNRIPLFCLQAEWYRKVGCCGHQDDSLNAAPLIESRLIFGLFFTKFLSFSDENVCFWPCVFDELGSCANNFARRQHRLEFLQFLVNHVRDRKCPTTQHRSQ